ncbi:polyisoprenyl-teichoic acid--peptidoglycan teichoic acid transferase TagU [Robertmurraya massiliosenegalensis]|uniref:polyisoprenyl-teichoic acid--peptidoglycan teichoic acid transferase TagU n=1 Tax=Robertmurraya massiliosenegalensis TaxID=1287657 RepID=UPI0002D297D3|nr:LytR family transcriptional regulator [Robertmurraya massiliosenegalensis]
MRVDKAKKKKRKWLRITGITLLVLLIGIGAYVFTIYKSLTNAVDTMHQPISREISDKRTDKVNFGNQEPFSALLLGVDQREGDKGRSDTIIVLTVNPELKSVKMLSIPRDTRTEIIGRGTQDKINHAYAFGNEEMSMATVENFLDIPIDYYIKVNMEGFQDIVEAVGGITVNNAISFTQDGHQFKEGQLDLNGKEALSFVRMRKNDPQGDFGRQERQRQVIRGVLNKGASFNSLTRFDDIFGALGKNVRTNMTFDEMMDIQKNYKEARHNIDQLQLKGKGDNINGIYYQIISDEEKQPVIAELKEHLEL